MFTKLYSSILDWNAEVPTLLIIIIFYLCLKYKQKHDYQSAEFNKKLDQNNIKLMPSPPKMPIIGHMYLMRDHQHNPWDGFQAIRKQFGHIVSLQMGVHKMALVSNSDVMREILLQKGDIFSDRPNFRRHHIIFGGDKENSLALCDWSNTHRDRRKLCKRGIVPNRFSSRNQLLENIIFKMVDKFIDNINQQHEPLYLSNIKNQSPSSPQTSLSQLNYHNVTKEDILFLTSDIFMEFLCSESHPHSSSQYREFVNGCDFVFWDINQSYAIDFLPFLTSLGVGYSYLRKLKRVTDFLRGYIDDKIFDPRRHKLLQEPEKTNSAIYSVNPNNDDDSNDYLDSLIIDHITQETSMSLSDYKVGFADLLAGHAAVANILMRLLGHLALDPKTQDMIRKEAEEANLDDLDHKPSLPVTEAAMQEALRIASSPIVPHVAREDTTIDNYFVPKGTAVLFNNYELNLSEHLWSHPLDFDPSRFLDSHENGNGEKTYKLNLPKHFIPFSIGLRQCLGYKMVESTTIIFVAKLCKKFVIKASDENLVKQLLAPRGIVALDPDSECYSLHLCPR